jgi:hypothetical protein
MKLKYHDVILVALIFVVCGCSKPVAFEVPSQEISRKSLVASLNAWRGGHRKPGGFIPGQPAVATTDALRADRPLLSYEIVGGLGIVDQARSFAVTLVLDSPRETLSTRYRVFGQDPIWVFQEDDFARILHWEHKMDPNSPEPVQK